VLLALGPVFVVLALFRGTRGLFTGWLKGVVLLALAPLFAVLGGSLMLDLAVPVLSTLAATPGQIDPQAAMAFFMVAAVHAALMLLVLRVSATMVSGWSVFGLANKAVRERTEPASAPRLPTAAAPGTVAADDRVHAAAAQRSLRLSSSGQMAANDTGAAAPATREVRLVSAGATSASSFHMKSRAQGIGSRFRAAPDNRWENLK
jgi:type IV secretion system protein VirB6